MPGDKGRHSPIAVDDQGRAIAAVLKNPESYIETVIDLSGPVEMDNEQMAAELSEALGPACRDYLFRSDRWFHCTARKRVA
jgi:NAD(P)H dehydrogenase (quinone)